MTGDFFSPLQLEILSWVAVIGATTLTVGFVGSFVFMFLYPPSWPSCPPPSPYPPYPNTKDKP